jgi:hypothetical protein
MRTCSHNRTHREGEVVREGNVCSNQVITFSYGKEICDLCFRRERDRHRANSTTVRSNRLRPDEADRRICSKLRAHVNGCPIPHGPQGPALTVSYTGTGRYCDFLSGYREKPPLEPTTPSPGGSREDLSRGEVSPGGRNYSDRDS